ncbi:hypothetical protein GCM10008941_26950 [Rhizomicrobium palustre]
MALTLNAGKGRSWVAGAPGRACKFAQKGHNVGEKSNSSRLLPGGFGAPDPLARS